MCIFASALYIKLGKQLILLYFKTMQNSDSEGFCLFGKQNLLFRFCFCTQVIKLLAVSRVAFLIELVIRDKTQSG